MPRTSRIDRRSRLSPRRNIYRPRLEVFEARVLLANFTVINTNDSGAGSLRAAIASTLTSPGADSIDFAIPTTDPNFDPASGTWTISLLSQLSVDNEISPPGVNSVSINGTNPSTNQPTIVLTLGFVGTPTPTIPAFTGPGLTLNSNGNALQGLVIRGFRGDGLVLNGSGNTIQLNSIQSNSGNGVSLTNGTTGNTILANDILSNLNGVSLSNGASGNTIGGTTPGVMNVIAANASDGVVISGANATGNTVAGNRIGADTGVSGNSGNGVSITGGAFGNTIGGTTSGARNIISGNFANGVSISGSGTTGNTVAGNFIGTDVNGASILGNSGDGVLLSSGASGNTIGGQTTGAGNLISGNSSLGIEIRTDSNVIQGNLIGTDATGTRALGNVSAGILVGTQVSNLIGGTTALARNIISGNNREGIFFQQSGTATTPGNNRVEGNYIGTDVTGTRALANVLSGISLQNSTGNTIGGSTIASRNLISGNGGAGISLNFVAGLGGTGTQNNQVLNNYIGTDVTGNAAIGGDTNPNPREGISILDSSNNVIGGPIQPGVSPTGNTIAFNTGAGVHVISATGTSASGNSISGNTINSNGSDGITLQSVGRNIGTLIDSNTITNNLRNGVWVLASSGNSILTNTISGNANDGVRVDAGSANPILSNSIFANTNRAIELTNNGNNNQAAPILTTATSTGSTTTVAGTLQGEPLTSYRLQFYSSAASPPPGFGEGETLIGDTATQEALVLTDSSGFASFNITLPVTVPADRFLTATATSQQTLNTSEFSRTSPNLVVRKTASPEPVFQTQELTYTVTLTNMGASPTPGVTLTDTLPAGVTFVSASGSVTPVGNTLTIPIGTLNRGATVTYTIIVRADTAGTITNTATVTTTDQASNPDLNPADNTATVNSTVVPVADLAVTKTADFATIAQFENLTYTVTVTNQGPSTALGVVLTDTLPGGATFVSATGGATPDGNTLSFGIRALAPGASETFTIVVQLTQLGTNVNTARVASQTADLVPGNDSSTVNTTAVLSFVVTTTADSGPGSLRQAILNVNSDTSNPLPDMITFRFNGVQPIVIRVTEPLPAITHPVIIDGTPLVGLIGPAALTLDGTGIATSVKPQLVADSPALLDVNARDSTIAGLTLRGYDGFGIKLDVNSGNVTLSNNRIVGFDPATSGGNRRLGGVLVLSDHNTIGGTDLQSGNVIAGDGFGVYLSGSGATANNLIGNAIGVDRDGNVLASGAEKIDGIEIDGASNNVIGPRNLIVDYLTGIYLFGGSSGNIVRGNTIRDTAAAPTGDPNVENGGVLLTNAHDNWIGGTSEADRNTIQNVRGSGVVLFNGATHNIVSLNTITGSTSTGVYLFNAPGNRVGIIGAGNTITGNNGSGVQLEGSMSSGNLVQANTIARNNQDGVYLFNAPGNTIGGAAAGEGNDIRSNAFSGIHLQGRGATDNVIQGNTIGGRPQVFGVLLEDGATRNTIGGTGAAANTFVGNTSRDIQVLINGVPPSGADQTGGNTISGNNIGTPNGALMTTRRMVRKQQLKNRGRNHAHLIAGHGHRLHPAGPRHLLKLRGQGRHPGVG